MNAADLTALQVHRLALLLPEMGQAEFSMLVDDIEAHGVHEPITLYEGQVLDGRHRVRAAIECGKPVESKTFTGSDAEAQALVLSLNLHRRHLTIEQRRALIANELKINPEQSDRAIAEKVKADHKTVGAEREKLEARGEIPHVVKIDSKGRKVGAKPKVEKAPMPDGAGKAIDEFNRKKRAAAKLEKAKAKAEPDADADAALPPKKAEKAPSKRAQAAWEKAATAFRAAMHHAKFDRIDVHPVLDALVAEAGSTS